MERENKEKEMQKRLERERIEKEKQERLEKEKRERERIEKEKQEKLEKERKERENERRRIEIEKFENFKINNSPGNSIYKKIKKKRQEVEEKEESSILFTGKRKYSNFISQSPNLSSMKKGEKSLKNVFTKKNLESMKKGILGDPKKEEYRIEIPKKSEISFKKTKNEKIRTEDSEKEFNYTYRNKKLKGKIYLKNKLNNKIYDDSKNRQIIVKNKNINKYKNNLNEGEDDYEDEDFYELINKNHKYQNTLTSNLSESFIKGRKTKIKIYKCVIWKNFDSSIDEETIQNILHRSGSHLLKNGGFIVKFQHTKTYKSNQQ